MEKINWDFKSLFKTEDDAQNILSSTVQKTNNFESIYKGNLKELKPSEFLEAIISYEKILQSIGKIMTYAFLQFAQDSSKGQYYSKYESSCTLIEEKIIFFELEFNKLPKSIQESFINFTPKYEFYLKNLQKEKIYQLSQKEERILLKKSITSSSAFSRLFDEHFSLMTFKLDGKTHSLEEILSFLYSPNRELRKKAANSLTKTLKPNQHILGYIYNMIKKDLEITCDLRGYKSPEIPRHNSNQITQKSVDALIKTTEDNFSLVQKYYEIKKKILGYDELYDYDRYAPINNFEEEYDFDKSKKIVLDAFGSFSSKFLNIASKAFDEGWIDVYPKDKKRSGAFSHPATPDSHPYVMLNHTNRRRDVFTLAHELGHAIHQYLSSDVGYLNSDTPLTTSETASVFAEMLVFSRIKDQLSHKERLPLIAGKLEDIFATLFRQINFTTFERLIHSSQGEISNDEINKLWIGENKKMFQSSVKLTSGYNLWWSYIPHFIHSPFYCYAYSYGQLLVLALYGLYQNGDKDEFLKNYIDFLSAGGSKSPRELVEKFGFDIEDENFWKIGLIEIEKLVNEFEGLANVT